MTIVEFEIEMVCLEIDEGQDAGYSPRKFPETIQSVLSLACHALLEFFAVDLRTPPHSGRVFEGAWRLRMIRTPWAKFPPYEGIYSSSHVREMGRAVTLEDSRKACWVRNGPAVICIVSETESRDLGIATRTENRIRTHAIEHPAAESHGLED